MGVRAAVVRGHRRHIFREQYAIVLDIRCHDASDFTESHRPIDVMAQSKGTESDADASPVHAANNFLDP
jgi:hypothetical protein